MEAIRNYVHINLRKYDKEIVSKKQPLTDEELTQSDIIESYHLLVGKSITHRTLNGCVEDFFFCRLRLYMEANSSENENFDKAYCRALEFRKQLIMPVNVSENECVYNVEPIDVVPSNIKGNDRIFVFDVNFKVKLAFETSQ